MIRSLIASALFVGLLGLDFGCAGDQKTPALALLKCRTTLLYPYLGDETSDLIRTALTRDSGAIGRALFNLGVTPDEIAVLAAKWQACSPPKPVVPKPVVLADAGDVDVRTAP